MVRGAMQARTFLLPRSHLMRFLAGAEEGDGGAIASRASTGPGLDQRYIVAMARRGGDPNNPLDKDMGTTSPSFLVVPAKLIPID